MGEKFVQEFGPGSGSIDLFLLGGFQPPRPAGGGPAAPRAPLHTERLRLSGSPFFLGTNILEALNLWVRCRRRFVFLRKMAPIFLEAPNFGAAH